MILYGPKHMRESYHRKAINKKFRKFIKRRHTNDSMHETDFNDTDNEWNPVIEQEEISHISRNKNRGKPLKVNRNESQNKFVPRCQMTCEMCDLQAPIDHTCGNCGFTIKWEMPLILENCNLPMVPVSINDNLVEQTCLDSGSTRTLITEPLAKQILGKNYRKKLRQLRSPLFDAQDRPLSCLGHLKVNINLGQIYTQHDLVVIKGNRAEAILGYDFMKRFSLVVIPGHKLMCLEYKLERLDCIKKIADQHESCLPVTAAQDITLQAGQKLSELRVQLHPDDVEQSWVGKWVQIDADLLQPDLDPMQSGVVPTNNLVDKNHQTQIYVHNDEGACPWIIKTGDIIGFAMQKERMANGQDKVNRILEHIQTEIPFYDDEDLEVPLDDIRLINKDELKTKEQAINEVNVYDLELRQRVIEILKRHPDVVSVHEYDIGRYIHKVGIKMNSMNPVWSKYRPTPPRFRKAAEFILAQLERFDIITRGYSSFAAQTNWVLKAPRDLTATAGVTPGTKDESENDEYNIRLTVDFSKLNPSIAMVQYPILPVRKILGLLRGSHVISSLDLTKAFWQVELDDTSSRIFAFEGCERSYRWLRLPMGANSSPAILSDCLGKSLIGQQDHSIAYSDNVLVFSRNAEEHLGHLEQVIGALAKNGWKISVNKSHIGCTEDLIIFGYQLCLKTGEIRPDPNKVRKIRDMKSPQDRKGVRRILGSILYFAEILPAMASQLSDIQATLKMGHEFEWTRSAELAFTEIKDELAKQPSVALPNFDEVFNVHTDAGNTWVGGIITQKQSDGNYKPVCFHSKRLSSAEQKFSQVEREALAIVSILRTHEHMLNFSFCRLFTDCRALSFIKAYSGSNSKLARWYNFICTFPHEIVFMPANEPISKIADLISRQSENRYVNKRPTVEVADSFEGPDFSGKRVWSQKEYDTRIDEYLALIEFDPIQSMSKKVLRILYTRDEFDLDSEQFDPKLVPTPEYCCQRCNKIKELEEEADSLDCHVEDVTKQRTERMEDLDRYKYDPSEEGQLFHASFRETALFSVQRLRTLQRKDKFFNPIIQDLENGREFQFPDYVLKDGVLIKRVRDSHGVVIRLTICIPDVLAPVICWEFHIQLGQHPTGRKLLQNLKNRYYIKNVNNISRVISANCLTCIAFKANTRVHRKTGRILVSKYPNHILHVDIITIGSKDDAIKDVFTMVDTFTNYVIAVPLQSPYKSTNIFNILLNSWVSHFGAPRYIHSDNATLFRNEEQKFLEVLGVVNLLIHPPNCKLFLDGILVQLDRSVRTKAKDLKDIYLLTNDPIRNVESLTDFEQEAMIISHNVLFLILTLATVSVLYTLHRRPRSEASKEGKRYRSFFKSLPQEEKNKLPLTIELSPVPNFNAPITDAACGTIDEEETILMMIKEAPSNKNSTRSDLAVGSNK